MKEELREREIKRVHANSPNSFFIFTLSYVFSTLFFLLQKQHQIQNKANSKELVHHMCLKITSNSNDDRQHSLEIKVYSSPHLYLWDGNLIDVGSTNWVLRDTFVFPYFYRTDFNQVIVSVITTKRIIPKSILDFCKSFKWLIPVDTYENCPP